MITKDKIYCGFSVMIFLVALFSILTSDVPNGILDNSLSAQWIILLIVVFLLPFFNLAEIILNRDDRNKVYWIGLVINMITIIFMMRYFTIELDFIKMFN